MLAFNYLSSLRVSADLSTEVLEDGTFWHTKSAGNIRKVLNVCLYTIESTLLGKLHLWHLVTIVWIVVLALWDAYVGCHDFSFFVF